MDVVAAHTVIITSRSSPPESFPASTLADDNSFIRSYSGALICFEMVFGLLVWTLLGGSDYSLIPGFGWVMFVAVMYWVLTVVLLLAGLTETKIRNPTLGLCFNTSATIFYLVSAAVDTAFVRKDIWGGHNFNCWAASSFFAFLVTLCYAGSTYLSFQTWRSKDGEQ
ncbi:CKLF-like MARVEL transmembrane domain-containing protein 8b [Osmerus mordax]|uniref:CKLF-like MARVEL transmembrane domain-containing protein 8b n=1 Tax=Osmerus mordax TaxID=8014 RepID=UPI00350F391F